MKYDRESLNTWPILTFKDQEAVTRVIQSGSLLKSNREVQKLQDEWATFTGTRFALAVDSCSHAIHATLLALGLKDGARIGVPSLGFVGTVHPVVQAGCKPVFIDVDAKTFNIDPALIKDAQIDALIVVHLHGLPCNMDLVMSESRRKCIPVIEDACQAHGASWGGRKVGSFGDVGCFSLNEVKNLPAGQGGLITTSDEHLYSRLRELCGYGATTDGLFTEIGFAYGLCELPAAVARAQLNVIEERIAGVQENARRLSDCINTVPGLLPPFVPAEARHVWHKYRVYSEWDTNLVVRMLAARGVPAEFWARYALPDHPIYQHKGKITFYENGNTRKILLNTLFIGTERYPLIAQTADGIDWICEHIKEAMSDISMAGENALL